MVAENSPLRIIFLWHQHQPYYKDFETGRFVMPWVRLHGTKDYLDMVRILEDFPRIKQTFNFAPSLIDQIIDYTENDIQDDHLVLTLKKAPELNEGERTEIVETFFSANLGTMIKPNERYYQIHEKVMLYKTDVSKAAKALSDQEITDLQVWSNLAWVDPAFRNMEPVKELFAKKREFTEDDKEKLVEFQMKILAEIVPAHREAQDRGQIEVSFSPYYHPILPLLIDTELAREAVPKISLPNEHFSHPEDARRQIEMSCELYRDLFGRDMRGMWPSEGSVAEKLLPILTDFGIEWIATDEEIFYASASHPESTTRGNGKSPAKSFHHPFRMKRDHGEIGIIFRDHTLSDKIGFVYSGWDAEKAANDFVKSLLGIRDQIPKDRINQFAVPIILDGENAWEYYKNDGVDFLRALYSRISDEPKLKTITVSEAFDEPEAVRDLPYLFAGSWINHNFRIWIGHQEDNRAWDYLTTARNALERFEEKNPKTDKKKLAEAWKHIYVAEGSDWCWWYGDEHSSDHDALFDRLFRSHLQAVYKLIEEDPPKDLLEPIRGVGGQAGLDQPVDMISPDIDGYVSHFYEWHDAGMFDCTKAGASMHRAFNVVKMIYFGFNDHYLYFRLDLFTRAEDDAAAEYDFKILLSSEKEYAIGMGSHADVLMYMKNPRDGSFEEIPFDGRSAYGKIIEISVPRSEIDFDEKFSLRFAIEVHKKGQQVERWPAYDFIHTTMPTEDKSTFWNV